VRREVPSAVTELPSAALGTEGGGRIPIDPRAQGGATPLGKVYQVDLAPRGDLGLGHIGSRVYVRFDHGTEPLVARWYRGLRQVFLSRLDV
jgi:putative peptide zinc metalloprotease protein